MPEPRKYVYWSEELDEALVVIYLDLKRRGFDFTHNGQPNATAIIRHLLLKEAARVKEQGT